MQTIDATQTKTRFDMYQAVHKGLRAFMSDVLTTVGRIDASDPEDVAAGVALVRRLLEICGDHLFKENQFVHTAMEARRYGSSRATANDHVKQEELVEKIEAATKGRADIGSGARSGSSQALSCPRVVRCGEYPAHGHRGARQQRNVVVALHRRRTAPNSRRNPAGRRSGKHDDFPALDFALCDPPRAGGAPDGIAVEASQAGLRWDPPSHPAAFARARSKQLALTLSHFN
jgi:hypothetical protein